MGDEVGGDDFYSAKSVLGSQDNQSGDPILTVFQFRQLKMYLSGRQPRVS